MFGAQDIQKYIRGNTGISVAITANKDAAVSAEYKNKLEQKLTKVTTHQKQNVRKIVNDTWFCGRWQ